MKRLTASFDVSSDLEEFNLRQTLEGLGAKYMKTSPNTESLKDDPHYKKLYKQKKELETILYNYIDSKR